MAAHLFRRYIWLLDQVSLGGMTYEKISDKWEKSPLNDRPGEPLPPRTFHNHIKAIEEMFDIRIRCQRQGGYTYTIEQYDDVERSKMQRKLLDHLLISNIYLEQENSKYLILPRTVMHNFVTTIFEAISQQRKIKILWGWEDEGGCHEGRWVELAPYYIKGFTYDYSKDVTDWYVYGLGGSGALQIYDLTHITKLEVLNEKFEHPQTSFEQVVYQAEHTPINQKDSDDSMQALLLLSMENLKN